MEEKEPRRIKKRLRRDPEDNMESLVMPLLSDTGGGMDGGGTEEVFRGEERRRRRKAPADHEGGEDVHGKMKVGDYILLILILVSVVINENYYPSIISNSTNSLKYFGATLTMQRRYIT